MQPWCRQVPPTLSFSTRATDSPARRRAGAGVAAAATAEDHEVVRGVGVVRHGVSSGLGNGTLRMSDVPSTSGAAAMQPPARPRLRLPSRRRSHERPEDSLARGSDGGVVRTSSVSQTPAKPGPCPATAGQGGPQAPRGVRPHAHRRRGVRRAADHGHRDHGRARRDDGGVDPAPGPSPKVCHEWANALGIPSYDAASSATRSACVTGRRARPPSRSGDGRLGVG